MPENCMICRTQGERSHAPEEDSICHACGKPYFTGCKHEHHHDAWAGCFDGYWDIRQCPLCDEYIHKECSKDGSAYVAHGLRSGDAPATVFENQRGESALG